MNITGHTPEEFDRIFSGASTAVNAMRDITTTINDAFQSTNGNGGVVNGFSDSRRNYQQPTAQNGYVRPIEYPYGYAANNGYQSGYQTFYNNFQSNGQYQTNVGYAGFYNPEYGNGAGMIVGGFY